MAFGDVLGTFSASTLDIPNPFLGTTSFKSLTALVAVSAFEVEYGQGHNRIEVVAL
jgi:uncharacterized membrane protein